jgi:hypothetical protein
MESEGSSPCSQEAATPVTEVVSSLLCISQLLPCMLRALHGRRQDHFQGTVRKIGLKTYIQAVYGYLY